jgi:hypothetical protein
VLFVRSVLTTLKQSIVFSARLLNTGREKNERGGNNRERKEERRQRKGER